jgi:hypothetical protein
MILQEILNDYKLYPKFFSEKLWRLLLPNLKCSKCDKGKCHLIGWGTRTRIVKNKSGDRNIEIPIQRLFCDTHNSTISLLPGFILPHVHYLANVVDEFIDKYIQGEPIASRIKNTLFPDERTLRRWIGKIKCNLNIIMRNAFQLYSKNFYTSDEMLRKKNKEALQNNKRNRKLINLWAMLKTLSIKQAEYRTPYHYVMTLLN